jgi:hypothetical protein
VDKEVHIDVNKEVPVEIFAECIHPPHCQVDLSIPQAVVGVKSIHNIGDKSAHYLICIDVERDCVSQKR